MFTCFLHPRFQDGEQSLSDICPEPGCGRPYSWPLDDAPKKIGEYAVEEALGRGFYSATYLVRKGRLGVQSVLKVTPVAFYDQGIKRTNFLEESLEHKRVAENTTHLAQIRDIVGDEEEGCEVDFDGTPLRCYVAVLDYVKGRPLVDYLNGSALLSARGAAQIAMDLLALLGELEGKGVQHNDLHTFNIMVEELPEDARRARAVDEGIRAVAIDFGSLAEASASDPEKQRLGDVHQVAKHLKALSVRLLSDPEAADENDYRLASALDRLAHQMSPARVNQRAVNFEEQVDLIRETVFLTDSPWRDPGDLPRFGEAYNAATLKSWYIPKLLVDPGGHWRDRISTSGPQLITGMRGCGKTMLLRALEVHGRTVQAHQETTGMTAGSLGKKLKEDHWVGLYESATRLLDTLGEDPAAAAARPLHEPHARLLVAYAREAVQALRHLSYLDPGLAIPGYARVLGKAVAAHIRGAEDLEDLDSELSLEWALQHLLIGLSEQRDGLRMATNPSVAFPDLADAIRRSSPLWHDATVLFLLDDVSTRNLNAKNIRGLWSSLLFKDERCAFKMTTEAQTIEQLQSPGLIETAQIGRDVDVFYLDEEVNERTRKRGGDSGRTFIASILEQRAAHYTKHPGAHPEQVLGGGTLEAIAREIASATASGRSEESLIRLASVYRGLNALSAVCVGDIGDVIAIYEAMLREAPPNPPLPLPPRLQSGAFQRYSRRRLYHLNRRGDDLRSFAASFAKAAHELLVDSMLKTDGKRLRQYSSIRIQIDRDRQKEEYEKILKLVDAGVFVFDPGERPRLRTLDGDPTASFILNYRKLFGLFEYIGLGERDRFELKGKAITEWLANPSDHRVLTRRGGLASVDSDEAEAEPVPFEEPGRLFSDADFELEPVVSAGAAAVAQGVDEPAEDAEAAARFMEERVPTARSLGIDSLEQGSVDALVLGLGFEERTLASAERLLDRIRPGMALAVRYPEAGRSKDILELLERRKIPVEIVDYATSTLDPLRQGSLMIDTTGLTKSLIFNFIRAALIENGRVLIAHTRATEHWPLNTEIEPLLDRFGDKYFGLMEAMEKLNSGDIAPYRFVKLLPSDGDQSRSRLLCASSTAKHERLLSLVENREYDGMQISVPSSGSPRAKIALIAAEIAGQKSPSTQLVEVPSDDLVDQLRRLGEQYNRWYHRGMEVELALTGSKMQAVACAALSSSVKLGQCWYVRPDDFDTSRFSRGTGETDVFDLTAAKITTARSK